LARSTAAGRTAFQTPCVILSGGETTVTVKPREPGQPKGRGGRAGEFCMGLAQALQGHPGIWALAADTDGIDGVENNAGAKLAPDTLARAAAAQLKDLRDEAALRLKALSDRPPAQAVPDQFVALSNRHRHAIAVDTSRARLYLFENNGSGPRLVADYYISVGKLGVDKGSEGDQRTPLGDVVITGPTHTNVNDFRALVVL